MRTLARAAVGSNAADLAAYQGIAASIIVAEADPIGGFVGVSVSEPLP
jgi:hypothetical protein